MFCHNCGRRVPDGSKFCDKCGSALQPSNTPISAPAAPKQNPFAEPGVSSSSNAYESEKASVVKWVVVGIIAILVLGIIFDIAVLSKASSDFDHAVKESNRQYDRAVRDLDRHMNSIRW